MSGGKAGEAPTNIEINDDDIATKRYQGEFEQADTDSNGKLAWNEWTKMLYHENPQHPRYVCVCIMCVVFAWILNK